MPIIDAPSPGGWFRLFNLRVAAKVVIGLLAANGAVDAGQGVLDVYGKFQGAQAEYYIEAQLESATVNTVTYSALNPLPEGVSGAILAIDENLVFVGEVPSPATRLSVCTATGAAQPCRKTSGSSDIMSGVVLDTANRALLLSATGSITANGVPPILAPRNYTTAARKYVNATFTVGSGQTVSGNAPAFMRLKVVPCNFEGIGC